MAATVCQRNVILGISLKNKDKDYDTAKSPLLWFLGRAYLPEGYVIKLLLVHMIFRDCLFSSVIYINLGVKWPFSFTL